MKNIGKIALALVVFFITSIIVTIARETNIPYLAYIPLAIGTFVIFRIFKK
jgi:hypothetical protein